MKFQITNFYILLDSNFGGNFGSGGGNFPPGGCGPPPPNSMPGGPPPGGLPMGPGGPSSSAPPTQPLPSNVLSKGGQDRSNMEGSQYMQTSSQIYVFSTSWANKSAEAVFNDQFPSIVMWHESQPETKKALLVSFKRLFLMTIS